MPGAEGALLRTMPKEARPRIAAARRLPEPEPEPQQLPLFEGPPRLLSASEVAELLGISRVSLWQWTVDGKFPKARDLNGHPVWRSNEVQQFLDRLPLRRTKADNVNV